jgi:hypothetical protein
LEPRDDSDLRSSGAATVGSDAGLSFQVTP